MVRFVILLIVQTIINRVSIEIKISTYSLLEPIQQRLNQIKKLHKLIKCIPMNIQTFYRIKSCILIVRMHQRVVCGLNSLTQNDIIELKSRTCNNKIKSFVVWYSLDVIPCDDDLMLKCCFLFRTLKVNTFLTGFSHSLVKRYATIIIILGGVTIKSLSSNCNARTRSR